MVPEWLSPIQWAKEFENGSPTLKVLVVVMTVGGFFSGVVATLLAQFSG